MYFDVKEPLRRRNPVGGTNRSCWRDVDVLRRVGHPPTSQRDWPVHNNCGAYMDASETAMSV